MTPSGAVRFVRKHGVVLESSSGPVPSLAEAVAGAPIRGSWWGHPRSHEIFRITRAVRGSAEVLVCRLVEGKVTYVHRRLWPALIRAAERFPRKRLAQVREIHTDSGRHITREVPFPGWAPREDVAAASHLDLEDAVTALGAWCARASRAPVQPAGRRGAKQRVRRPGGGA